MSAKCSKCNRTISDGNAMTCTTCGDVLCTTCGDSMDICRTCAGSLNYMN